MRYHRLMLSFIFGFILQLSVNNIFMIKGITPNLILSLVLVINFLYDYEYRTIGFGLIFGLLLDIAVGKFLGVYALTLFIIGLLTLIYKNYFNYENKLTVGCLGILGTFAYHLISTLILSILGVDISILRVLIFFPISMFLNISVMYILYVLMLGKAKARKPRRRYERYETI